MVGGLNRGERLGKNVGGGAELGELALETGNVAKTADKTANTAEDAVKEVTNGANNTVTDNGKERSGNGLNKSLQGGDKRGEEHNTEIVANKGGEGRLLQVHDKLANGPVELGEELLDSGVVGGSVRRGLQEQVEGALDKLEGDVDNVESLTDDVSNELEVSLVEVLRLSGGSDSGGDDSRSSEDVLDGNHYDRC